MPATVSASALRQPQKAVAQQAPSSVSGAQFTGDGLSFDIARQATQFGVPQDCQHRLEIVRQPAQRRQIGAFAGNLSGRDIGSELRRARDRERVIDRRVTFEVGGNRRRHVG
jgi:hypothetical protein